MRKVLLLFFLFIVIEFVHAQNTISLKDSLADYFAEIKNSTEHKQELWGINLYGPMLLVNPATREVYANYPDSAGLLKADHSLYSGTLPVTINISNTSVHWSGRDWAMIMLPLPKDKITRVILLAHELFHRSQKRLGYFPYNPDNNHLDQKDGRIYLRLELEALKKAFMSSTSSEMHKHIGNALTFRNYRHQLYAGSDSTENRMELNEGITEYSGFMVLGISGNEAARHFINNINAFLTDKSYVRSFAYQTIPVYGYLLSRQKKDWHRSVNANTNLTDLFSAAFNVHSPADAAAVCKNIAAQYDGTKIISEENKREEDLKKLIAAYKSKFIEQPHFDIFLEKMNISFDYRIIMPLEDKGTVYPKIRVTDKWGILDVSNGSLMSPAWNNITVSAPVKFDGNKISGDGWILELNEKYTIEKNTATGNYSLKQK